MFFTIMCVVASIIVVAGGMKVAVVISNRLSVVSDARIYGAILEVFKVEDYKTNINVPSHSKLRTVYLKEIGLTGHAYGRQGLFDGYEGYSLAHSGDTEAVKAFKVAYDEGYAERLSKLAVGE